ncbi:hypothetical protein [Kitasatospora sp. MBT63]|uniref:hypothetical protein n=1 Tax=Kitasatospora sp. MBT63 TaxID=1444768 RepID=UPI00068B062B|nr:hypothetical protein [Kitasatospora sp. MBT63]
MSTRPIRAALVAAATAALLAGAALPAAAAGAHPCYPALLTGHGDTLVPEGATWDPLHGRFLVGSLRHGTVQSVAPDGSTRTLVDDPDLVTVVGLHVDAARGRVLLADADTGGSVRSTPGTTYRRAWVGAYDLTTGRRLFHVDLAAVAADGGPHVANDLAFGPDGTAYVTDSMAPVVYRVGVDGSASVLVRDDRLASPAGTFGLNGIVREGDTLVVGHYQGGTLWRIPLSRPSAVEQIRVAGADGRLVGLDGLLARPDGAVLGVTNAVGGTGHDAEVELRSSDGWHTARLTSVRPSADIAPTALTPGPDGRVYQLSGRVDLAVQGTLLDEFTLRRV